MRIPLYQIALLIGFWVFCPAGAFAQEPPVDTVEVAPPDDRPELDVEALARVTPPLFGEPVDERRPALRPIEDATELLHKLRGSFLYDLGMIGWPHAWSPLGLNPNRQGLHLNGRASNDLLTGRPRYDLLPLDIISPLHLRPDPYGSAVGTSTRFLDFDRPEPLTEIRYRRASHETGSPMQGVMVFHSQRRRLDVGNQPGLVNIMGAYTGRASDNEYPNDDLRAERNLLARVRYRQANYSLEIRNQNTRREIGAHAGVIPDPPGNLASVYDVFLANVRNANARRRVVRNDLSAVLQVPYGGPAVEPLVAQGYWTAQFFRYRTPQDTAAVQSDRFGLDVEQTFSAGNHHITAEAAGYVDRHVPYLDGTGYRSGFHAGVRDSVRWGGTTLTSSARLHAVGVTAHPSGHLGLQHETGLFLFGARVQRSAQQPAWVERAGLRPYLEPLADASPEIVSIGEVTAGFSVDGFAVTSSFFAHQSAGAMELVLDEDHVRATVETSDQPVRRFGVTIDIDWRRAAQAGFYASGHATAAEFPDEEPTGLARRILIAMPQLYGTGRIGYRATLFHGDLDLDGYVKGRFWTDMRSRAPHPATGLMGLPALAGPGAVIIEPGGVVDLQVEATIRDATIFLGYDNALSGTVLQQGAFIAPIYPLPAQQFRLGVYWPILD